MSVYNGAQFLAEAITSVLEQSYANFEFLILDDGSSDCTRAIIEDFAKREARIQPIFRENRGLVASLNQLLGEARAPIIARMDADDICQPTRFAKQIEFLNANLDYGVIGSCVEDIDEHGQLWPHDVAPFPATHEQFLAAIETGDLLFCHSSVMYRRAIVLGVGGYHVAFPHCEDLDLWLRLANVTRLANLSEKLLHYRRHAGQVSNLHATLQHTGAAVARLAYKERKDGREDPTETLTSLPAIDELDVLFNRAGTARDVRAIVAIGLQHSRAALQGDGFEIVLRYLRDGGGHSGMWRTVARLISFGEPARALQLATALARTGFLERGKKSVMRGRPICRARP